jgi:thiol-disulfide isomerase/thioredoxin
MSNRETTLLLKKSGVAGKIPTSLKLGELAINFSDVILYASGTTANSILPIGWDRVARTGDTMTGNLDIPSANLSANNLIVEHHQQAESQKAPTHQETKTVADTEKTFDIQQTRHVGGYALRKLFHESDRPLLVKYVSPTCGPCRTLKPILDKVVDEYDGKIHFIEIDIEADPEIAQMGGVTGTPTVQIFKDKELLSELKGVKQKSDFRSIIDQALPIATLV